MRLHLPNRRATFRVVGIGLTAIGLAAASVWFLWLVPAFSRFDPQWEVQFTQRGYWTQVQRHIRRFGWTHDDFDVVGRYGDRTWAAWIMQKAEQGEDISDCGNIGHKDAALQYITCQNPVKEAEGRWEKGATEKAWLAWWKENKDRTQEQWIQDGLARYGVPVHAPSGQMEYEPLLALLGNTNTNRLAGVPHYAPRYVKYNAFRWLRDSGFDPLTFAVSNLTSATPEIVQRGLFAYSKNATLHPKLDGAGILLFGKQAIDGDDSRRPDFFGAPVRLTAYSLILLPLLGGSFLLIQSRRAEQKTGCGSETGVT